MGRQPFTGRSWVLPTGRETGPTNLSSISVTSPASHAEILRLTLMLTPAGFRCGCRPGAPHPGKRFLRPARLHLATISCGSTRRYVIWLQVSVGGGYWSAGFHVPRGIVEPHAGTIRLRSQIGQGTRFGVAISTGMPTQRSMTGTSTRNRAWSTARFPQRVVAPGDRTKLDAEPARTRWTSAYNRSFREL